MMRFPSRMSLCAMPRAASAPAVLTTWAQTVLASSSSIPAPIAPSTWHSCSSSSVSASAVRTASESTAAVSVSLSLSFPFSSGVARLPARAR